MTDAKHDSSQMDRHRRQYQTEWRHLCETLENAQAEDLIRTCRDKCQFVKTFRIYGNGLDQLSSALRDSARHGQYGFFCERGLPRHIMTPALVDSLLDDWRSAIEGKKTLAREIFRLRYHEDVETCIQTCQDWDRLDTVARLHESDAILTLSAMAQPRITYQEIDELRREIAELRLRLDQCSALVQDELTTMRRLLSEVTAPWPAVNSRRR